MKFFENFFKAADHYIAKCKWTDIALLKFCLAALGILIGSSIPDKSKKPVQYTAAAVFIVTYIPLIIKFIPSLAKVFKENEDNMNSDME